VKGLTEGRSVHYVIPGGRNAGECRAATVVRAWDRDPAAGNGCANLTVFTDWGNDSVEGPGDPLKWKTSVYYERIPTFGPAGETQKKGNTWHWPTECEVSHPQPSGGALLLPDAPVECGSWLAVTAVVPGQASFRILPHELESPYPYLVGYECLHQPNHICPGDESMEWPNGPLGDVMLFNAPTGGPYRLIVAKYVLVEKVWVPTRACSTVEVPAT